MNILFLASHLNTGGITSYIYSLACGLKAKGHNVYVAASSGDALPRFIDSGITFLPLPIRTKSEVSPKILFSLFKLLPQLKDKKIEVIHANTRVTQVLACLAAKFSGAPFVSTCHGFFKTRFSRRFFPCWGTRVIAISQQVQEHLVNDFKVDKKDVTVILHGMDTDRFRPYSQESRADAKKKLGLGSGPAVGIVARLSGVKGHSYLIEAMQTVLQSIPAAQLVIAGEGKLKDELEALSRKLGIAEKVFFIPTLADTTTVLSALDIFVLPSLNEGLGLSLMEAMACGICPVGSNVGGIKTLIKNGDNGILVEPKDTGGISAAISGLLKDPGKMKVLGDRARESIIAGFSLGKMVSRTEEVYQECLK